jgi:hypothetical protein
MACGIPGLNFRRPVSLLSDVEAGPILKMAAKFARRLSAFSLHVEWGNSLHMERYGSLYDGVRSKLRIIEIIALHGVNIHSIWSDLLFTPS